DGRSPAQLAEAARPHVSLHLARSARRGGAGQPPHRHAAGQDRGGGAGGRSFRGPEKRLYPPLVRRPPPPRDRARGCRRAIGLARRPTKPAMSDILLAIMGWDPKGWEQRFRTLAPQHTIHVWPEQVGNPGDVHYACVWNPPPGLLAGFPNLKAIFSLGAGADEIMADPKLPDVPVVRVVDSDLTMRMTEYVVLHVLMHHRRQRLYDAQQRERLWR